MKWYLYRLTLSSDTGKYVIHTKARNKKAAIATVLASENCPESAIKLIERL